MEGEEDAMFHTLKMHTQHPEVVTDSCIRTGLTTTAYFFNQGSSNRIPVFPEIGPEIDLCEQRLDLYGVVFGIGRER